MMTNVDRSAIAEEREKITAAKGVMRRRQHAIYRAKEDMEGAAITIRFAEARIMQMGGKVRGR